MGTAAFLRVLFSVQIWERGLDRDDKEKEKKKSDISAEEKQNPLTAYRMQLPASQLLRSFLLRLCSPLLLNLLSKLSETRRKEAAESSFHVSRITRGRHGAA